MKIGLGSILMEPVAKDELLVDFEGHGIDMDEDEAWIHERDGNPYVIQVDDSVDMVSSLANAKGIDYLRMGTPSCVLENTPSRLDP